MAEGFARYYGGDRVHADSAGLAPVGINPHTIQVMNEVGVDISHQTSDPLSSKDLQSFDYIITLCGDARDACPALPAGVRTEHWPIADPVQVRGIPWERVKAFRIVRNQVEERVKDFLARIFTTDKVHG